MVNEPHDLIPIQEVGLLAEVDKFFSRMFKQFIEKQSLVGHSETLFFAINEFIWNHTAHCLF